MAEKQNELENSDEYSAVTEELEGLPTSTNNPSIQKKRADFVARRRQLRLEALRNLQQTQIKDPKKVQKADETGHYRTPFSGIRDVMPIRRFLADAMFTPASIRSKEGRDALRGLITLYKSETEVECRRGLEPDKCNCPCGQHRLVPRPYLPP